MAGRNPKSEIRNPKLNRLVPLLLNWFSANARDLPWRRTRDPYAIWVSEIMLQQTQVKTVIPYWERWMRELPSIKAAANASPDKIHKLWEGLGYYTRARNLQKAAQQIVEKHGGTFPRTFDDVLALPGIGRYTAGAICSIAFNQPTPILDGNVIRVLTRIFGIAENPKKKETNARLWKLAGELIVHASRFTHYGAKSRTRTRMKDEDDCYSCLNQSLMELGALICTPRNPQCPICPVKKLCAAFRKNRVNELPNLGKREAATPRRFVAFVVERNGRFLVRQRPAGVVNAHLWEFPNAEVFPSKSSSGRESAHCSDRKNQSRLTSAVAIPNADEEVIRAAKRIGLPFCEAKPLCTVKHSITRYRITLEAFRVRLKDSPPKNGNCWKSAGQLHQLAFSSAHKKVLNQLP